MYEYLALANVRPDNLTQVCQEKQVEGYSVEQIDMHTDRYGVGNHVRYAIVFKRPSKDISYGQMLINRYSEKLREVRDLLRPMGGQPSGIADDIDKFLFDGSPEDM